MKVLYFCGWPLGTRGTPGTYKLIEQAVFNCEVRVLTPPPNNPVIDLDDYPCVVYPDKGGVENKIQFILDEINVFRPHIIHIFNHPDWAVLFEYMWTKYPNVGYFLDIKTPLLRQGEERNSIQEAGQLIHSKLNNIFSLANESVETWIPGCTTKLIDMPLGIDFDLFPMPRQKNNKKRPLKFVYIGALNEKRKITDLVRAFDYFVTHDNYGQSLDIYGSGGEKILQEYIRGIPSYSSIIYRGLLPQAELLAKLIEYDMGLAWVPCDLYDTSPSLKLLEFMAAGLPVLATATSAHLDMSKKGFYFDLATDNYIEFGEALLSISRIEVGVKNRATANKELLTPYRYENIFKEIVYPAYLDALKRDCSLCKESSPPRSLSIVIVIETLYLGRGGAEKIAVTVANEMANRGHRVYVAYLNKGDPKYRLGNSVHALPYENIYDLRNKVISLDPDIYFVFYFNNKLISFYSVVYGSGIPFGMQECTNPTRLVNLNWKSLDGSSVGARFERELIAAQAARIRMVMPSYGNSFPDYIHPNVKAFSNPCPLPALERSINASNHNIKYIICINGFKPNKGLDLLVESFALIHGRFPDWRLLIVGKDPNKKSEYVNRIFDIISICDMHDKIVIKPSSEDISDLFVMSDIHVIASSSEGCPTVVLEAMAYGLLSVGLSDCPGTNELIKHNENGLLVSSDDPVKGFADALSRLIEDPNLRTRLSRRAYQDSYMYDHSSTYDKWEELFLDAASYKNTNNLFNEQILVNRERALHAKRSLLFLLNDFAKKEAL